MNCTIKLNISYLFKVVIEKLVSDISFWKELRSSEEYRLLRVLNDKLFNEEPCDNRCMGCLDYMLMSRIFYGFVDRILEANKDHEEILRYISDEFGVNASEEPLNLAVDLFTSKKYVEKVLQSDKRDAFGKYVEQVEQATTSLVLDYCNQRKIELFDDIETRSYLMESQKVSYEPVQLDRDRKIFYVDQNFISRYQNERNFEIQVQNSKKNSLYRFVYSPYLIEDGIKMNRMFLRFYFESILSLTDGVLISRYNDQLCYVQEELDVTVDRVLLWLESTRAAEKLKVYKAIYNHHAFPFLNRNTSLVHELNKDIIGFFDRLTIDSAYDDENVDVGTHLHYMMISNSFPFTLYDIKSGQIAFNNDYECMNMIEKLAELLDYINFQTEAISDREKLGSSYQDIEHLKHGWKSDYFVTDDKKLSTRGEFIYSLLGIETKFLNVRDFKKMMVSVYA